MRCFDHIAKLIKTKRIQHPKGYSQSELSAILGYKNGQFISNVERALCNIPLKMLRKISETLDISSQELKEAILKDHEKTLENYLRGQQEAAQGPRGIEGLSGVGSDNDQDRTDLSAREAV